MKKTAWNLEWRQEVISQCNTDWDLIIIGGGITGAGIFRSAVSAGLKTLLLEAHDFAFGTSSRSSKLVHGGFRYLYNKQFNVTYESVTERQRFLREANYLVDEIGFNLPNYDSYHFSSWFFQVGLGIYDLMGRKWDHQSLPHAVMQSTIPGLSSAGYLSGFRYKDAVLDDARLVFRVIRETVIDGGTALNYAFVQKLLRDQTGRVIGVAFQDHSVPNGKTIEVTAKSIINASGPWSDSIRKELHVPYRLRPLRGSHLIISYNRLPVHEAITFFHPADKRAMFVIPWEGATLIGTTDIDHSGKEFQDAPEPFANHNEIEYILQGIEFLFPHAGIGEPDIISSFAGLRPVINTGAPTPSKESRAHQVWEENGLITISGGKLTTFRIMAADALNLAADLMGKSIKINKRLPMVKPISLGDRIDPSNPAHLRLLGRSGAEAQIIVQDTENKDFNHINGLPSLWAELQFAASAEGIVHLDDLLLRRTRIGMLLPSGGREFLSDIKTATLDRIGWTNSKWKSEEKRYLDIWNRFYSSSPGQDGKGE